MRKSLAFFLFTTLAFGCSHDVGGARNKSLSFSFQSADIASALAEDIDPSRVDKRQGAPAYQAQVHIQLSESGVQRFQRFAETHAGQHFDLLVYGETLLAGLGTGTLGGGVREMFWYVGTMDEAKRFAALLTAK